MELSEFVKGAITTIVKSVKEADDALREEDLGRVWTDDMDTNSQHLVNLRIIKGKTGSVGVSCPVMLLDFDVNVAIRQQQSIREDKDLGGKAGLRSYFEVSAEGSGGTSKSTDNLNVQNLKFTVPVCYQTSDRKPATTQVLKHG